MVINLVYHKQTTQVSVIFIEMFTIKRASLTEGYCDASLVSAFNLPAATAEGSPSDRA